MKTHHLVALAFIPLLLTGCAANRPISDLALGAGGAALADEFSHGNPAITAAGAAGGVLVSEGLQYASQKQAEKAYTAAYEKGRSDAVKQQYWILVNQQKEKAEQNQENVRYYEIPVPEQTIDGTILNPTTKLLRIEE
jgi:capsule polysaccharide export protein KpsE/RkpR